MRLTTLAAVLLSLLFLSSCSIPTSDADGPKTINIPIKELDDTVKASDIVESAHIIPLETTDECLIARVDGLVYKNDYIYIRSNNQILRFDSKGKFISKISKRGNGPDEYNWINSFAVDNDGNIHILNSHSILLVYNQEGEMISRQKMNFPAQTVTISDKLGELVFTGEFPTDSNDVKLRFANGSRLNNDQCVRQRIRKSLEHGMWLFSPKPVNSPDHDYSIFSQELNDTIYRIDANGIAPYATLNYGSLSVPAELYDYDNYSIMKTLESNDYAINFGPFYETDNYILTAYKKGKSLTRVIIDKNENRLISTNNTVVEDKLLHNFPIKIWTYFAINTHTITSVLQSEDIIDYADALPEPAKSTFLKSVNFKDEEQNPVIYIATLK